MFCKNQKFGKNEYINKVVKLNFINKLCMTNYNLTQTSHAKPQLICVAAGSSKLHFCIYRKKYFKIRNCELAIYKDNERLNASSRLNRALKPNNAAHKINHKDLTYH